GTRADVLPNYRLRHGNPVTIHCPVGNSTKGDVRYGEPSGGAVCGAIRFPPKLGKRITLPKHPAAKGLGKIVSEPLGPPPQHSRASTRPLPFWQSTRLCT